MVGMANDMPQRPEGTELTSENVPLQVFIPGEGLPAISAERHCEMLLLEEARGWPLARRW